MLWLFLIGTILIEVAGTLSLRLASEGRRLWFVAVGSSYLIAFTISTQALAQGMSLIFGGVLLIELGAAH